MILLSFRFDVDLLLLGVCFCLFWFTFWMLLLVVGFVLVVW